ncbi:9931_t:CDS:1, partial [Funneliformis mosseae]
MPKIYELSDFEHGEIIGLLMAGHGVRKIAKVLGQPRIIVQDVITKYKEENRTDSAPLSG